ncbi:hypothetical protein [uncultured Bacteroides sp.]|uniref:hypothetical protein n=1 Tax=uncultured Bacteroides sp. TaxID=162156 RepID=UPI0026258DF2|nr:hypothetical protein [uncultured Bacteroides sp.]
MNCVEIPKNRFFQIEPLLKECYGVDRHTISNDICLSVEQSADRNDSRVNDDLDKDNKIDTFAYAIATIDNIKIPVSDEYNQFTIENLCCDYNIDSAQHDVLFFMFLFSQRDKLITGYDEAQQDYLEYAVGVRPEMLQLYIALHNGGHHMPCKITFGDDKPIKIDNHIPWLQMEMERYLNKYLGVKDRNEAEKELLQIYGKKVGAKANPKVARYIWGTYHLLQTIPMMISKRKGSVTREQSKFITEYLTALKLINSDTDSEMIRGRLNYFLKSYESIEELLEEQTYKTSPNNTSGWGYY